MIDVGQIIDKYELLERVGQGGMAVVYRGLDRSLKRHVAVKVLHRHLADHDEARDRFEREAHAVAKLRHENILEIFDYSKSGDESYIVTEFIDGKTLKQFITDHPPRYAEIGAMIAVQICRALGHAHGQGVLHRDVKPENVMIRSDGVVKLTDFGIAQMVDVQRMTVTGQLLGSPAYMSPEHVEGRPLDFRTDVFALGIVLYQLTVGKLPFEGKNPHEILKRIAECKFPDPRQANPRVGNELGRIILKAMSRDPDARYPVINAMLADLEHYLEGSGLGTGKEELARYFASPSAYELALGARLTDHLMRRARDEIGKNRAGALQLLDRVLTMEPGHTAALELLNGLERRRRVRRVMLLAGVVLLAGGGAWGARRMLGGGNAPGGAAIDAVVVDAAAIDGPAVAPIDAPIDGPAIDAPLLPPIDAPLVPQLSDGRRILDDPRRADARMAIDAPALAALTHFSLLVSPEDAEVQVGDGPWQRFNDGRTDLSVATGTRITVRRDDCCEAETFEVTPATVGRIPVTLSFLPAQVTPLCDLAGVSSVTIDGARARLGIATPIFFTRTLSKKDVKVEFVIGDAFDRQEITLRPKEAREVRCNAP